jgi:lipopolysaccharide biosynthesis glycosyltransferase
MLKIFVGFDGKIEPIAYHTFCQSIIERSSIPVSFTPLALNTLSEYKETHTDGSNAFIYSRFLVPYLCDFKGMALFVDGDMICRTDIAELLWEYDDQDEAVKVVKHYYQTKHPIKYLGAKNEDYEKKNWSSVMLWNCGHHLNRQLTPRFVMEKDGKYLHRFQWLKHEDQVGKLDNTWNWLAEEYEYNPDAKLIHYTIGTPCFKGYQNGDYSQEWFETYQRMIYPLKGKNRESEL